MHLPQRCAATNERRILLTGPLEPTNEPYAIAKIAGLKMCAAYNRQYGTNFMAVMPTNLYGPGDNYDLENSHVIPALIRKIHEAKQSGAPTVTIWGTGTPKREFLFSDDLADACIYLMRHCRAADIGEFINIGSGEEVSISELAVLIAKAVVYQGKFVYDKSKPDGVARKIIDKSKINSLGWTSKHTLFETLGHLCEQRSLEASTLISIQEGRCLQG
jgi:GDP-L-fucose synthase